jgi:hypothetical protein
MTRAALRAARASLLIAMAVAPVTAHADVTKGQCVDANSNGQSLRLDGKLAAARHELQLCSDAACPAVVRTDCAQRMDELERAQPTIVFDVKDGSGADLIAVNVTVDAHPLAEKLDGTAMRVDPGEHTFTFTVPGQEPVSRSFVVKEGEKGRRERIVIGSVPASTPPPHGTEETAGGPAAEAHTSGLGTQKIVGLTAGGLGIAGIAGGSVFGLMTFAAASDQNSDCSSTNGCPHRSSANSEHATGSTDGAVSTVAFIAGGALLVTGVTLFFTAHSGSEHPAPSARTDTPPQLTVLPALDRDFAGMSLRGEF